MAICHQRAGNMYRNAWGNTDKVHHPGVMLRCREAQNSQPLTPKVTNTCTTMHERHHKPHALESAWPAVGITAVIALIT